MGRNELASKCWDGANGVTAFACAQMVAFLLSLLSAEVQETVSRTLMQVVILISISVFWLLYSGCIWWITNTGFHLLEQPERMVANAWKQALWGRLGVVLLFSVLSFCSLLAPKM
jgi:hypothetical protein